MLKNEIAELMEKPGAMFDIAEKVNYNQKLTPEEKEAFEISDAWAKEVGRTGKDPDKEIASYVQRTVIEETYNTPDELLDTIMERGSIGEFDTVDYIHAEKNTLVAHEAAKGGTVDRSWLDISKVSPIIRNRQVETDLSYADLRRNGFKSIAKLTTYAIEALQNAMFFDIFSQIDNILVSGDQVIVVGASQPTQAAVDEFTLYLLDRSSDAVAVCLTKYAQALGRMSGYYAYMSDAMKENFNRYGLIDFIGGVRIASISGAHKTGLGEQLVPDLRIFGCAGKIGALDMVGDVHVYQDEDNSNEKVILRVKDFTYSIAITNIENCNKMVLTA